MNWPSLNELVRQVKSGKSTAQELVQKALNNIDENSEFKSIIIKNDNALAVAKEIDKKISDKSEVGRLAGIPFIAKDNFLTKGVDTTAASNILSGFNPPYSATAVKKLESEGAIMIAKANLDSFAHGSSTENSDFETTLNPHDKSKVPGGSSGGSAAAVVLGLAPFALGTDTGGSIRQPASFTGSVGLKPTYGLVSRYGVVAMASSTDVIGPITSNVEDAALVLEIISGKDKLDSTTIDKPVNEFKIINPELKGRKVGIIKEHMGDGLDSEVRSAIEESAELARKAGAEIKEVSIPSLDLALAVYYIVMPAEVSSNLSRYDGIRYGYSDKEAKNIDEIYDFSRTKGFNSEVKRRIMIGTYVLSSGYYDAYYKKAQTVRTLLINQFNKVFEDVDFLIGPTAPTTAFKIGQNVEDPLQMYLSDIMTVSMNLVGVPAISIPVKKDSSGMPIGLQITANQTKDNDLLNFAAAFEKELEYES